MGFRGNKKKERGEERNLLGNAIEFNHHIRIGFGSGGITNSQPFSRVHPENHVRICRKE